MSSADGNACLRGAGGGDEGVLNDVGAAVGQGDRGGAGEVDVGLYRGEVIGIFRESFAADGGHELTVHVAGDRRAVVGQCQGLALGGDLVDVIADAVGNTGVETIDDQHKRPVAQAGVDPRAATELQSVGLKEVGQGNDGTATDFMAELINGLKFSFVVKGFTRETL